MRQILMAGLMGVALCWSMAWAAPNDKAAQAAVDAFLKQVDAGKYKDSYKSAAAFARKAATEEQWTQGIETARKAVGPLKSRKLEKVTPTKSLPGAPAGDYLVYQYKTAFEKQSLTEVVVMMHEKDGHWGVGGYSFH